MIQHKHSTTQPIYKAFLGKRLLAGVGVGLLLISFFLLSAKGPHPEWGKLWMIRPLIIVPLAGAMGGVCNYILLYYHRQYGLNKLIAMIISTVVWIVGLWLGIVLGLNGTTWN